MNNYPTDVRSNVVCSLPTKARWFIDGTPLDFDFSPSLEELQPLPDGREPIHDDDPTNELLVFALQNFAEGGGAQPWLCVRMTDGWICGFDPDCDDDPIFVLNSSIHRFVNTFLYLNQYLQSNEGLPYSSVKRLFEIDPDANAVVTRTAEVSQVVTNPFAPPDVSDSARSSRTFPAYLVLRAAAAMVDSMIVLFVSAVISIVPWILARPINEDNGFNFLRPIWLFTIPLILGVTSIA